MERLIRNELLLGKKITDKLNKLSILVVGCGGVGGYAIESLARLGVGNLTLVDFDKVELSNFNRQIIATSDNLNKSKVEAFKQRLLLINDKINVDIKEVFYNKENEEYIFDKEYDFVVDAIDTISLKWELIKTCLERKIKFISSMGMANRIDLTKVEVTTLAKTCNDPISKKLRQFANKEGINLNDIPVVFSKELPIKQNKFIDESGSTFKEKYPPSSIIFTPSVAGLLIGQYILEKTINE